MQRTFRWQEKCEISQELKGTTYVVRMLSQMSCRSVPMTYVVWKHVDDIWDNILMTYVVPFNSCEISHFSCHLNVLCMSSAQDFILNKSFHLVSTKVSTSGTALHKAYWLPCWIFFSRNNKECSGYHAAFFIKKRKELLPPATKLGQGYVFTGVCDSVHRGGYLTRYFPPNQVPPGTSYTHPPRAGTPPRDQVHPPTPWDQVHPPQDQVLPPGQVHPPGPGTPPWSRYTPPGPGTPPDQVHPPPGDTVYAGRYASYWNAFLFSILIPSY